MELLTQTKINGYQNLIARTNFSSDNKFTNAVLEGNTELIKSYFFNASILEAKALRTKLNSIIEDVEKNAKDTFDFIFLNQFKESIKLTEEFKILDSYDSLIVTLLDSVEQNVSNYSALFPKDIQDKSNAVLNLYPQSMSLSHYKEIFELIGYAPNIEEDRLHQLTDAMSVAFLDHSEKAKSIDVLETYAFSELSGVLREKKIKEIAEEFWKAGRLENLEFVVKGKGGSLLLDGAKVKVFQVEDTTVNSEKDNVFLIYATPAFYSYTPEKILNKKIGNFLFLDKTPKMATCIIEVDHILMRQDFVKSPTNTDNMMFKVKIQIPVNLFKFYVKKIKN